MFRIDNVMHRIRKRKWHKKHFHWKCCISWNYVIVLTNRSANALDNNKRNRFILRARSFLILRFPRRLKFDKDVDQQVWSVRSFSFIFPNWLVVIHPSLLLIHICMYHESWKKLWYKDWNIWWFEIRKTKFTLFSVE